MMLEKNAARNLLLFLPFVLSLLHKPFWLWDHPLPWFISVCSSSASAEHS